MKNIIQKILLLSLITTTVPFASNAMEKKKKNNLPNLLKRAFSEITDGDSNERQAKRQKTEDENKNNQEDLCPLCKQDPCINPSVHELLKSNTLRPLITSHLGTKDLLRWSATCKTLKNDIYNIRHIYIKTEKQLQYHNSLIQKKQPIAASALSLVPWILPTLIIPFASLILRNNSIILLWMPAHLIAKKLSLKLPFIFKKLNIPYENVNNFMFTKKITLDTPYITNNDFKNICKNCPNIEKLNLARLKYVNLRDFTPILKLKNLKQLKLSGSYITNNDFKNICKNCPNIEYLNISINNILRLVQQLTDFTPILKLKKLKVLSISGATITNEQIKNIKQNNPKLEIIQ